MAKKPARATDATRILHRRIYAGKPSRQAQLENARASADVARKIYKLRTDAGLTQKELATLVGTSHSVISRLEDDDYEGHSLGTVNTLAGAGLSAPAHLREDRIAGTIVDAIAEIFEGENAWESGVSPSASS